MRKENEISNYYFWENRIKETDDILIGNIDGVKITVDTPIIYIGILDKKKGILKSGWSVHESIDSALGFINYVFLPTAFFTWGARNVEGFYVPLSPIEIVMREIQKENSISDTKILQMNDCFKQIGTFYDSSKKEKYSQLELFCNKFNLLFDEDLGRKLFLRVFEKTEMIVDFVFVNDENEFEEVIEEEMNMSINDFKFICENVYVEPFINKTFIEQLNTKMEVWF
ncbi:MAG: hypothetical protein ACLKAK_10315 [Alkaliphilus sp.]